MKSINELLPELKSRLPELEWKMSTLNGTFSSHSLPRGLFRTGSESTGIGCVEEIKADIETLSLQKNERSACYLAERIRQKVNVLVALCQMDARKGKPIEKVYFGLNMLSTRQQWLQTLEADIAHLTQQQQALAKTLEQMNRGSNAAAILSLKAELGEVERRLTLAREALNHAIS